MSTNKINIEAVNARAREEQTPMTKIQSVEQPRCKKLVENGKAVCNCILNCHLHDWRQKDHTIALLTELRDCGLLEEKPELPAERNWKRAEEIHRLEAHNTLARDIKEFMSNMDSR